MERKDAIEIIKKNYPDSSFTMLREALETLIPELKESEDEKVIRDIKVVLESSATKFFKEEGKMPIWYDRAIAWLKKKGEQKPQGKSALEAIKEEKVDNANKVEHGFKVGDWVVNEFGDVWHIDSLDSKNYQVSNGDKYCYFPIEKQNEMHIWTIQDAKPGDVLCCESGWTCIFKALDNHTNTFSSYSFMDKTGWFCKTGSEAHTLEKAFIKAYNGNIFPATKEQRELLFSKMKEAGYEWDANHKQLKKIEQKPAWSEEDKRMIDAALQAAHEYGLHGLWFWLKCLKERVLLQNTWKPSDEQIKAVKEAACYSSVISGKTIDKLISLSKDLKKLKG